MRTRIASNRSPRFTHSGCARTHRCEAPWVLAENGPRPTRSATLRASHRNGHAPRRALNPIPRSRTVTASVPIVPVAHAFRAGSRIRVTVEAPGGDRPRWRFDSVDDGSTRVTVHLGRSKLTLPVLQGVTAPTPLPAPTALRGQPSRAYIPAANGG